MRKPKFFFSLHPSSISIVYFKMSAFVETIRHMRINFQAQFANVFSVMNKFPIIFPLCFFELILVKRIFRIHL